MLNKDTTEVLDAIVGLGSGVGKALEDGKINFSDASFFFGPLLSLPKAISGISNFELLPEDMEEAKDYISQRFDIPQDDVEQKIEDGLDLLRKIYQYVSSFIK